MSVVSKSARVLSAASLIISAIIAPAFAARADGLPTTPANFTAQGASMAIKIGWDAPTAVAENVTEWDPYVSDDKGKTWQKCEGIQSQLTMEDTGLGLTASIGWYGNYKIFSPMANYKVKLIAVSPSGNSPATKVLSVTLPASAPVFGTGGVGADQKPKFNKGVTVKWLLTTNGGKPVTKFVVSYRKHSADGTGAWTVYKTVSKTTLSLLIPYSKLKGFTDFDVAVDATNSVGTGHGEAEIKVDAQGVISVWI